MKRSELLPDSRIKMRLAKRLGQIEDSGIQLLLSSRGTCPTRGQPVPPASMNSDFQAMDRLLGDVLLAI